MAPIHVVKHWARITGNSIEEEKERFHLRAEKSNESFFKRTSYEKYLDKKANFKLGGNFNER